MLLRFCLLANIYRHGAMGYLLDEVFSPYQVSASTDFLCIILTLHSLFLTKKPSRICVTDTLVLSTVNLLKIVASVFSISIHAKLSDRQLCSMRLFMRVEKNTTFVQYRPAGQEKKGRMI